MVNAFNRVQENMAWDKSTLLPFVFKNDPGTLMLGIFACMPFMATNSNQLFTNPNGEFQLELKGARAELNKEGTALVNKDWYPAETVVEVKASNRLDLFNLYQNITARPEYLVDIHKLAMIIPTPANAKTQKRILPAEAFDKLQAAIDAPDKPSPGLVALMQGEHRFTTTVENTGEPLDWVVNSDVIKEFDGVLHESVLLEYG